MTKQTTWGFEAMSDLTVVDHNPEMADIDHPRGEIVGYRAFVRASNAHGDTRILWLNASRWERDVMEPAEKLAQALNKRMTAGKLPVAFERWVQGRAVYGSDAYIEYGEDEELALERDGGDWGDIYSNCGHP